MFDDYTPSYDYGAPFDCGAHFDYAHTYEDPMAYVVPAVPDALAFDPAAPNAAVGFAMNEVARCNTLAEEGARLADAYALPYTVRADGWPDVANADLLGHTVAEVRDYYRAKFDFELATYGRIISLQ